MPLECSECNRLFTVKSNLTRHYRMVHNIEMERMDIRPADFDVYHYKCLEGCQISFRYNRDLRNHLRIQHNINIVELNLDFPNNAEFHKWLSKEEKNNCVQFVHLTATKVKSTGGKTFYYECNRTGKRNYVDEAMRKRRPRKWTIKLNRGCTSQIIVNKSYNGSISVNYFKNHYGHDISPELLKLSKQDRGAIASKLFLGLPISTVLQSVKNPDGNPNRINLLGRKDVTNIQKSFNIDLKDGKLASIDTININSFLMECSASPNNPILYYSVQDFPQATDIQFIIMSDIQRQILQENGGQTLLINVTHLNNCNFDLITLFIVEESFPAACMFTNKTSQSFLELFFDKIHHEVLKISPKTLITNCHEIYEMAWHVVMGEAPRIIYNPIQVDLDLKLNLNRISCNEADVTKMKRKWVYETLKLLQNMREESEFVENFEAMIKVLQSDPDFADFHQYFTEVFGDAKKWAKCYQNVNISAKQLQMISDVLKQYLNEDIEIRFDKIFHSLIRFIRDESVNAMLKNKINRGVFVSENDARHHLLNDKHLNGIHLSEDLWNVSDEDNGGIYVVQKYLDKKCCNLTCSLCHICIHCFSCSCVDFFMSNAICLHIHHIWVTYFQSLMDEGDVEEICDDNEGHNEVIVIEVDETKDEQSMQKEQNIHQLQKQIVEQITVLSTNIVNVEHEETLKAILDTVTQLCDISSIGTQRGDGVLADHSYL